MPNDIFTYDNDDVGTYHQIKNIKDLVKINNVSTNFGSLDGVRGIHIWADGFSNGRLWSFVCENGYAGGKRVQAFNKYGNKFYYSNYGTLYDSCIKNTTTNNASKSTSGNNNRQCEYGGKTYNAGAVIKTVNCAESTTDAARIKTGEICNLVCLYNTNTQKMIPTWSINSCPGGTTGVALSNPNLYEPAATGYRECVSATGNSAGNQSSKNNSSNSGNSASSGDTSGASQQTSVYNPPIKTDNCGNVGQRECNGGYHVVCNTNADCVDTKNLPPNATTGICDSANRNGYRVCVATACESGYSVSNGWCLKNGNTPQSTQSTKTETKTQIDSDQLKQLEQINGDMFDKINNAVNNGTNQPLSGNNIAPKSTEPTFDFSELDKILAEHFVIGDSSVWKDASGNFNTARLASDSVAGIVLGAVGGVVASKIIKKNQIEKGFDDLKCTIAGQDIASYGDEFSVGAK